MLRNNLIALRMASAVMNKDAEDANRFTLDELHAALGAFASMIRKTEQAQAQFPLGSSQHTLLRNRLQALHMAEARRKENLPPNLCSVSPNS